VGSRLKGERDLKATLDTRRKKKKRRESIGWEDSLLKIVEKSRRRKDGLNSRKARRSEKEEDG